MKGRPAKLGFSGLFLPCIEWEMKLEEIPWRDLEDCPKVGTLMRNARRQDTAPDALKLEAMITKMASGDQLASPQLQLLLHALHADDIALRQVEQLGAWSCFVLGQRETFSAFSKAYSELEPACARVNEILAAGKFADAASEVMNTAEISIFWRHRAAEFLAKAQSVEQTLAPRLKAWLELQMSVLAKVSLTNEIAKASQCLCGSFRNMLTGSPAKPGKIIMRHFQQFSGLGSLASLKAAVADLCVELQFPSDATFNRWCSGSIFPAQKRFEPFLRAAGHLGADKLQGQSYEQLLFAQFYVARRFTAVLAIADLWRRSGGTSVEKHLGASTPSQWAVESFDHWQQHWREMLSSNGQC